MAAIDTWTDATVERACRLLRLAEGIVAYYRNPGDPRRRLIKDSIRPVTIDRFLVDVCEFNNEQWKEAVDAEAAADGQGEGRTVDDRSAVGYSHVR
jgi:hypothetical protein